MNLLTKKRRRSKRDAGQTIIIKNYTAKVGQRGGERS
jgi:hypothetical protein